MLKLLAILVIVALAPSCDVAAEDPEGGDWYTLASWDGGARCGLPDVVRLDMPTADAVDCDGRTCWASGSVRIGYLDISVEMTADRGTGHIVGSGIGRFSAGPCSGQEYRFASSGDLGTGVVVQQ